MTDCYSDLATMDIVIKEVREARQEDAKQIKKYVSSAQDALYTVRENAERLNFLTKVTNYIETEFKELPESGQRYFDGFVSSIRFQSDDLRDHTLDYIIDNTDKLNIVLNDIIKYVETGIERGR